MHGMGFVAAVDCFLLEILEAVSKLVGQEQYKSEHVLLLPGFSCSNVTGVMPKVCFMPAAHAVLPIMGWWHHCVP
jgi:hypothetical protein